jgi:uncharacterized membrane protein YcfT
VSLEVIYSVHWFSRLYIINHEAASCRNGMSVWMVCPCVASLWMNRDVMVVNSSKLFYHQ